MGWFLTSGKSKGKKKTKRGGSAGPKWDPHRTLLGVKFAGIAGAGLALALAWHFGSARLEAYVAEHHARPVAAEDVHFTDELELLSPDKINLLRSQIADLVGPSPMDREGLQAAAELLRKRHDLVRELRQVRRMPDGTIRVDLDFRTPAAIVLMSLQNGDPAPDGYHVIDDMGFHMQGPNYLTELDYKNLPLIRGVSSDDRPMDNHGQYRFDSGGVDAALALIKVLKDTPAIDFIDSISVNVTDERDRMRLVINTQVLPSPTSQPVPCMIVWGLPPGQEKGVEVDADRKVKALLSLLADGRYRMGHWREVWINTGYARPAQAIVGGQ